MWYVKHPFDCIVMRACADKDGGGQASNCQTAGSGGGRASSRTQTFSLLRQRPFPAAGLMSGRRNVENRAHWGALFSKQ